MAKTWEWDDDDESEDEKTSTCDDCKIREGGNKPSLSLSLSSSLPDAFANIQKEWESKKGACSLAPGICAAVSACRIREEDGKGRPVDRGCFETLLFESTWAIGCPTSLRDSKI